MGIGAVELWRIRRQHPWLAASLLLVAAAGTLWLQASTTRTFTTATWWLPGAVGLLVLGAAAAIFAALRRKDAVAFVGYGSVIAAILVTPGIWSGLGSLSSGNQSLPGAYEGRSGGQFGNPGDGHQVNQTLLSYLESHTQGMKYLVAVPSSGEGQGLVLATGRPVLYLGGFSGQDKVATGDDLARMAADGELKYILWGGRGPGGGGQSDLSSWIQANCTPVQGLSISAGTAMGGPFGGPGGMQGTLYEINATAASQG